MNAIKEFIDKKSIGWYVSAAALLCAINTLIIYTARGGNAYSPVSALAVVMLVLGIVLNAGVLFKDFRIGGFIPFIFYVITFGVLMNTEMLFFTNVLTGLDGNVLDGGFIAFFLLLFITIITSAVAASMRMTKEEA